VTVLPYDVRQARDGRRAPLAACALGLLLTLAAPACSTNGDGDTGGPGPTPPGAAVEYTALGASDAIGIGSSAPCLPFVPCPEGRGYVQVITRELQREGRVVTLSNLGVPGFVLSPTVQAIGNRHGRGIPGNFLEQQLPFVRSNATLVTVFAGGNDVNAVATAVSRGEAGGDVPGFIAAQVRQFASDYATLVRGVRTRAGSARIVVLNLPNLSAAPYTAGLSTAERRWMQEIAVGFSREGANATAALGATVVDLMCDPRTYQPANFSSDGFHPSDAGYAFMAAEVLRALSGGTPAPQQDCGFMRVH
jgi:lysophospholipase L1-like esterase